MALNCWGRFDEMVAIANLLPEITPAARARLDAAMATIKPVSHFERIAELAAKRDQLLALAAWRDGQSSNSSFGSRIAKASA